MTSGIDFPVFRGGTLRISWSPAKLYSIVLGQRNAKVTRLETFIQRHDIKPSHLAKLARISRQHLLRVRHATMEPTRHVVARLTIATAIILERLVAQEELFDLWEIGKDKGWARRKPSRSRKRAKRRR